MATGCKWPEVDADWPAAQWAAKRASGMADARCGGTERERELSLDRQSRQPVPPPEDARAKAAPAPDVQQGDAQWADAKWADLHMGVTTMRCGDTERERELSLNPQSEQLKPMRVGCVSDKG